MIVHAAVVEKMDALDRSAGGLLQTRFRLVNGVLKDAELMVPNGPPYKSEYQGY